MRIHLEFYSILSHWVGDSSATVDLPAGSTFADLLAYIDWAYGDRMPDQLWSSLSQAFATEISVFQNGEYINDRFTVLRDEDHFRFMAMMGGG